MCIHKSVHVTDDTEGYETRVMRQTNDNTQHNSRNRPIRDINIYDSILSLHYSQNE